MRISTLGWLVAAWLAASAAGRAQPLNPPFEIRQTNLVFNLQSFRGVPISTVTNDPPGSDGRAPNPLGEITTTTPTLGQFQSWVGFGALAVPLAPGNFSEGASFGDNALNTLRPVGVTNSKVAVVLRSALVGGTFVTRPVSFLFGSIIPVPETDETGKLLSELVPPARPEDYWFAEPQATGKDASGYHTNAAYYWSPHARVVFAIQPGPIKITWKRVTAFATKPSDFDSNPERYSEESGFYYRLFEASYVVSGSASKAPRRMYWTEGVFRDTGRPVTVPTARVGDVHVVHNGAFPERVVEPYVTPGQLSPVSDPDQQLQETRTLWYDSQQGQIFAFNREGRVFVELLGDSTGSNTRRHLGFEIVDVLKQPTPDEVSVDLGDRMVAYQDRRDDSDLRPEPIQNALGLAFTYRHIVPGSDRSTYYATRETQNANDVFFHWLQEGELGLLWPFRLVRYALDWPVGEERYSHYVRPPATTDIEAQETAVNLPAGTTAGIEYQDALDVHRAQLTADSRFYTRLDSTQPVHRTLLRYISGNEVAFERVYSWLDEALASPSVLVKTLAEELEAWNPATLSLDWNSPFTSPRIVVQDVAVAQRLEPPADEVSPDPLGGYWAGHIRVDKGISYHPDAYLDPFVAGFEAANLGAIIPVNAIPNANRLEVWWFRKNGADRTKGFQPAYWPSVIGKYTIGWPVGGREIILASNDGSGGLESLEAKGSIYTRNTPGSVGYNPNEEHAVMLGGQAYALRDDLNNTNAGPAYSSAPFVLLEHKDSKGRPKMAAFRVLREKPEEGEVFDYLVKAGTRLQAPMPLPLLAKPVEGEGEKAVNYNTEPPADAGDLPGGWNDAAHGSGADGHYRRFTYRDRKEDFWVYRALHAGLPTLEAGTYVPEAGFSPPAAATAIKGQDFTYQFHASRLDASLTLRVRTGTTLPSWLRIEGLSLKGTPAEEDVGSVVADLVLTAVDDDASISCVLNLTVAAAGAIVTQGPVSIVSSNTYTGTTTTFIGRPPYLATDAAPTNTFSMRYYYRTLEGFAWPGYPAPPAVGSIVPYLRPADGAGGFVGDPTQKTTTALDIVYRPFWPYEDVDLPKLNLSDTLTTPKNNLPAVRGNTSARVLYQQSRATNLVVGTPSVVLHDATRDKVADLLAQGLEKIPAGVRTESLRGSVFFPNLPPHLAKRVFMDPNRGPKGSLVLRGEYVDPGTGDPYILLNVLRGSDLDVVKKLCPDADADASKWNALVDALATRVETFRENPAVPGTYIPDETLAVDRGVGDLAEVNDDSTAVDSYSLSASGPGTGYVTLIFGNGRAFTPPGEPVTMNVIRVRPPLYRGEIRVLAPENPLNEQLTFQHTPDVAGRYSEFEYDWRIGAPVDGQPPLVSAAMTGWTPLALGTDIPRYTLGGSGIQTLADNYVVVRYRAKDTRHPLFDQWSDWTEPMLAEGWIKRVLAGINPFNQRVTDLFNNRVNTDVSLLTQAGTRWEGDVALNLANINSTGLIPIYETVLKRGKSLSISAGINYGPANDALLLAAGYLNDLYMMLGGEAWADALNPTIGIGTRDRTYGDIATALFAFKGQAASLLDEELGLLRGRDDFLQPGVETRPVYNRMFWNYTRGIDAGEVVYALNYNIQEDQDAGIDGVVNADDARKMFPQGHGDAYGHYLTAAKGYYELLMDTDFDWVPRTEAVLVLGKPVQVDYLDERKFAAAAAAVARTGRQVYELTWRQDYRSTSTPGWGHLAETRTNTRRTPSVTRYWGLDHWASRTGQGGFLGWVVGNAILPDIDPDPDHEGIQKIDRNTVPELLELASTGVELQTVADNAEARLSPLGLPEDGLAFDIDPQRVLGPVEATHFEQVYERATVALGNAVAAFDDAKDVTRLMRSEQDSLAELQAAVDQQEIAYERELVELYGTPYSDDIGPGKTYAQGYAGPDYVHYRYVDLPELPVPELWNNTIQTSFKIDLSDVPGDWTTAMYTNFNFITKSDDTDNYTAFIEYNIGPHGFSEKPSTWTGRRATPGEVQQVISEFIIAHRRLKQAMYDSTGGKADLDKAIRLFESQAATLKDVSDLSKEVLDLENDIANLESTYAILNKDLDTAIGVADLIKESLLQDLPDSSIFGTAFGGDVMFPARIVIMLAYMGSRIGMMAADAGSFRVSQGNIKEKRESILEKAKGITDKERSQTLVNGVYDLFKQLETVQAALENIQVRLREFDDAQRKYRSVLARGDRIQNEREIFRRRTAGVIQGFRTRDAAFRIFRSEKLERYQTLFSLAARYTLLAANAYDYETGLLGTQAGRDFVRRIVGARALGVVRDGEPQYAGSNTGDPGLSSVLAEMKADWSVLRGRLGFNNPDSYGTTASLRTEKHRILPGAEGDEAWRDLLQGARRADLLEDRDIQRHCLQISRGDGLPVPGLVLEFSTTVANGLNLYGNPLAAGDHAFSPSSFATKIYGVGVSLEGYEGMDDPAANAASVESAGGVSPSDPSLAFLNGRALAATPYVYLIPVGVDSMRSPPLGDSGGVRTWSVSDVTIPMPFNIGDSAFSTQQRWQSSDFLTEPLFGVRKHQAFRPVSTSEVFNSNTFSVPDLLTPSKYTNRRLIGRSVWNSKWKLVIPGHTLLNDPNEGLDRFIQTVRDIRLHFVTYSYSGN